MLPELLRGLGLTVPGTLSNRTQQLVRAAEARLYYVPWWQSALEVAGTLAILAGSGIAGFAGARFGIGFRRQSRNAAGDRRKKR